MGVVTYGEGCSLAKSKQLPVKYFYESLFLRANFHFECLVNMRFEMYQIEFIGLSRHVS